jgi:NDP-sugar pyrophosphorylase family protein
MYKDLLNMAAQELIDEAGRRKIPVSDKFCSIILIGGKGTRLNPQRKLITKEDYPLLNPKFWGLEGPKGMAMVSACKNGKIIKKPMTDWHLDMHASAPQIKKAILSLGTHADIVEDYYEKVHHKKYKHLEIEFLIEKNPAGTLAPIIKLYNEKKLPEVPTILANGDNFLDADFYKSYLQGMIIAHELGIPFDEIVINLLAFVPWEESDNYGTIDVDFGTGLVRGFKEKAPVSENVFIEINGKKMTPINSGLSIINNPAKLFPKHLRKEVIDTSIKLENGELDYKQNENIVKYETFYSELAKKRKMVAIYAPVYWTDLGTEEKLALAEEKLPETNFFKRLN